MRIDKEILDLYSRIETILTVPGGEGRILNPAYGELAGILADVRQAIATFSDPLRVAVAGYMKAGKSTLLNAILQKKTLCTDAAICTFTPTWFRYGQQESMTLVFRDGHEKSGLPLSELEQWTSIERREENPGMDDVEYVILYTDNQMLKRIELIDTPGLFSPLEEDAERTIRLLGLQDLNTANELNCRQVSQADAILYAFAANFKENDLRAVEAFTSTSINAIGVFTKLDQSFWDPGENPEENPAQRMKPVIERNAQELRNRLYCILPVTGLPVEGFSQIDDAQWEMLCAMAQLEKKALIESLKSVKRFIKIGLGNGTEEQRKLLVNKLGIYGIYCVTEAIRSGVSREEMLEHLYALSGVKEVVDTLETHFGIRSFIIKTEAALDRIEKKVHGVLYSDEGSPKAKQVCGQIDQEITSIRNKSAFSELHILKDFYDGKITFPTELLKKSFLELMGEYGNSAAAKLGLPEQASVPELVERAKQAHEMWGALRNDYTLPRSTRSSLEVIIDSIIQIRYHAGMLAGF